MQGSHDDLVQKKAQEIDLLSKEIAQLTFKEKESRTRATSLENEVNLLKDQLRTMTTELDTRTQENDHIISLLEDTE